MTVLNAGPHSDVDHARPPNKQCWSSGLLTMLKRVKGISSKAQLIELSWIVKERRRKSVYLEAAASFVREPGETTASESMMTYQAARRFLRRSFRTSGDFRMCKAY